MSRGERYEREERGGRDRDRGRDDDAGGRRSSRDRDDDRGSRRGGSRFEYRRRDSEEAKRRADSNGKDFDTYVRDNIKFFKPADGPNTIRILPPTWDGATHYGVDIWVHYGVGSDRQTYLCPNKMKGERCPICEERQQAVREGDDRYAKDLAPTRRVLVYLIDRDHEKEGVLAWAMPQNLDRDIVKVSTDRRTGEVLPIDHPDEGFDVIFEKKGAKLKTEYLGVQIDRRDSPLGDDRWLDFAQEHPLPDQLIYYDTEHIAGVFSGGGVSRGDTGKDRDRDDDRGGRGRDRDDRDDRGRGRDRDDDDRGGRSSRDRDDDRGRDRGRSSRDEPELDWDSVHAMRRKELDALIEDQRLDIDPREAKDDEDLADWVCEELKLKKPEPREQSRSRERVRTDARDDDRGGQRDEVDERLAAMRARRRD